MAPSAPSAQVTDLELQNMSQHQGSITMEVLASINEPQMTEENLEKLRGLGGLEQIAESLGVDIKNGLTEKQQAIMEEKFGKNMLPSPPMKGLIRLFFEAFNDTTLLVLIAAAIVSLIVGVIEDSEKGWIEGTAILMACFIVSWVTAINDYTKEKQFRALEENSRGDEEALVLRGGQPVAVKVDDLVVGDVVILKAGGGVPADGLLALGEGIKADESSLTGEPEPRLKGPGDPFLISSSTLSDLGHFPEVHMFVIGVGGQSQWGKIREKLVSEPTNTPLQDKLDYMAKVIGYIGCFFATLTLAALMAMIWVEHDSPTTSQISSGVIHAFIMAVTIVVVAIPEGLPLAVTIALAYSSRKMYDDQNLIRTLAACETMGNATTICSDKTGTLTENQMTVVAGWFAGAEADELEGVRALGAALPAEVRDLIADNVATNNSTSVLKVDKDGRPLPKPKIQGSATEGALLMLAEAWGVDPVARRAAVFDPERDCAFPFNSTKKRSTAVVVRPDGKVRLYVKGASEIILANCAAKTAAGGAAEPLTEADRRALGTRLSKMADSALRTLGVAHREFPSVGDLPEGWKDNLGDLDAEGLVLDCLVGIQDPLRGDVREAVATAQRAGVVVRMVTGDNIQTARAIARQCGILTADGIAMEGPDFRKMTPAQVDKILPKLQVLARSSPDDKYLLVTRLNGQGLPKDQASWEEAHPGLSWASDRDLVLPGYREEWVASRGEDGGHVVGVTGDGTNDAPALKLADVGLSMGICGTEVARAASDIILLDDNFSSIVKAILWGRNVFDNIRKFLQFQLTVNTVALTLTLIGAVAGFNEPPLNAVMMLWVNLIMDSMGALALGTETPTPAMLDRKPYKREAALVSRPMWRNILCQSAFQLALLFGLLYGGKSMFGLEHEGNYCTVWKLQDSSAAWDSATGDRADGGDFTCADIETSYSSCIRRGGGYANTDCLDEAGLLSYEDFEDKCFKTCFDYDYTHFTLIFTTFVFCQVFNEFNARSIKDDWNVFKGLATNRMFMGIIIFTILVQVALVEGAGFLLETSHLTAAQWFSCLGLGAIALPVGLLMRFIPMQEDEGTFFDSGAAIGGDADKADA
mmetsp:Transcript_18408/g.28718  ORF Transcript_18408/g.28718 Transcript_18408/m.28718 type:complete len:1097 (+) Transcript_18408:145-3435(+)